jgi:tRNA nucleotidyltransferase/poly(A) polymerase
VNLRTENYTVDSRVPHIEIGTAQEDAYRRDLTINSLFYNVNTNQIEDFTGKGLAGTYSLFDTFCLHISLSIFQL